MRIHSNKLRIINEMLVGFVQLIELIKHNIECGIYIL